MMKQELIVRLELEIRDRRILEDENKRLRYALLTIRDNHMYPDGIVNDHTVVICDTALARKEAG